MSNSEAKVINAICKNKDLAGILSQDIDALFISHGDIWDSLKKYYNKYHQVPDLITLQERFPDLVEETVTGPTDMYIDQMKMGFLSARIKSTMTAYIDKIDTEPSRVLELLQTDLYQLNKYTHNIRDLNLKDVDEAVAYYERLRELSEEGQGLPGIKMGFDAIDSAYVTGMMPGHLIYMLGYSGRMKSWFSELVAINAYLQGKRPMIFSLEMSPENMRDRINTMMGQGEWQMSDLGRGYINTDDFREWGKSKFDKNDFIIVSSDGVSDVTPLMVQGKIDQYKPDVVILDYLQLFMDNKKQREMTPRMLGLSRELKLLAVGNNIPIVAITAVTDDDKTNRTDPPRIDQVSWSKAIEYDGDLAVAVHKDLDSDTVEIVGRKNRHGPLFDLILDWKINQGIIKVIDYDA